MAAKARKKTTKKIPLLKRATAADFQATYKFTTRELRIIKRALAEVERRDEERRKPPAKAKAEPAAHRKAS